MELSRRVKINMPAIISQLAAEHVLRVSDSMFGLTEHPAKQQVKKQSGLSVLSKTCFVIYFNEIHLDLWESSQTSDPADEP